eukprot:7323223-Pyramimonas_sp.AAC.1
MAPVDRHGKRTAGKVLQWLGSSPTEVAFILIVGSLLGVLLYTYTAGAGLLSPMVRAIMGSNSSLPCSHPAPLVGFPPNSVDGTYDETEEKEKENQPSAYSSHDADLQDSAPDTETQQTTDSDSTAPAGSKEEENQPSAYSSQDADLQDNAPDIETQQTTDSDSTTPKGSSWKTASTKTIP